MHNIPKILLYKNEFVSDKSLANLGEHNKWEGGVAKRHKEIDRCLCIIGIVIKEQRFHRSYERHYKGSPTKNRRRQGDVLSLGFYFTSK